MTRGQQPEPEWHRRSLEVFVRDWLHFSPGKIELLILWWKWYLSHYTSGSRQGNDGRSFVTECHVIKIDPYFFVSSSQLFNKTSFPSIIFRNLFSRNSTVCGLLVFISCCDDYLNIFKRSSFKKQVYYFKWNDKTRQGLQHFINIIRGERKSSRIEDEQVHNAALTSAKVNLGFN